MADNLHSDSPETMNPLITTTALSTVGHDQHGIIDVQLTSLPLQSLPNMAADLKLTLSKQLLTALLLEADDVAQGKKLVLQYQPPSHLENLIVPQLEHLVVDSEGAINDTIRQNDVKLQDAQQFVTSCVIALLPLCELILLKRSGGVNNDLNDVSESVIPALKLALYAISSLVSLRKDAVSASHTETNPPLIDTADDIINNDNGDDDNSTIPFLDTTNDLIESKDIETLSDIACNAASVGDNGGFSEVDPLAFLDEALESSSYSRRPRGRRKGQRTGRKTTSRKQTKAAIKQNDKSIETGENCEPKPEATRRSPRKRRAVRANSENHIDESNYDNDNDNDDEDYEPAKPTHRNKRKGSFQCLLCGAIFDYKTKLAIHRKEMHSNEKKAATDGLDNVANVSEENESHISCMHCEQRFTTRALLRRHILEMHRPANSVTCSICNKTFRWNWILKVHMKSHNGDRPFGCSVCGKRFSMRGNLNAHMNIHSGDRPYRCKQCGRGFKQLGTLQYHMTTHSGAKPFKCDLCGKNFTRSTSLRNHMTTIHTKGQQLYPCDFCDRKFGSSAAVRKHVRSMHWEQTGDQPRKCVRCKVCDKVVLNLKRHMQSHSTDKPFMCAECGKSFKTNSCLVTHQKIHTGVKPHRCDECGKCFLMAGGLKVHQLTHTGVKPHQCSVCGRTFTQKSILEYHMSAHRGDRPFECPICGKRYSRSHGLKIHTRTHTGEKPHQCSSCGKRFSSYVCLKRHIMTHTGERPYACPTCDKRFQTSGHMKRHLQTHKKEALAVGLAPITTNEDPIIPDNAVVPSKDMVVPAGVVVTKDMVVPVSVIDSKPALLEPQAAIVVSADHTHHTIQHLDSADITVAGQSPVDVPVPTHLPIAVEILPQPTDQTITYMW